MTLLFAAAHLIVLGLGAAALAREMGPGEALQRGAAPYLLGGAVKSLVAAAVVAALRRRPPASPDAMTPSPTPPPGQGTEVPRRGSPGRTRPARPRDGGLDPTRPRGLLRPGGGGGGAPARGARFVGSVLKRFINDDEVPWFRVLGSDGTIRVTGGTARDQAQLLRAEGVEVKRGRVDLEACGWRP